MDLTDAIYLVLAATVGAAFAYLIWRRDTGQGDLPTADNILTRMQEAISVAQALVAAAEQLSETGQIERDARFNYVYVRLRKLFPGLSQDLLIGIIEGAVWLVTKGTALLAPAEEQDADRQQPSP